MPRDRGNGWREARRGEAWRGVETKITVPTKRRRLIRADNKMYVEGCIVFVPSLSKIGSWNSLRDLPLMP
jgi:hypothetical protein